MLTMASTLLFSFAAVLAASKTSIKGNVGVVYWTPNTLVDGPTFKGYLKAEYTDIVFDYHVTEKYPTTSWLQTFESSNPSNCQIVSVNASGGVGTGLTSNLDGITMYKGVTKTTNSSGDIIFTTGGTECYVLSKGQIMANASCKQMFALDNSRCKLKRIVFNNFDTSNVTNMSSMFNILQDSKTLTSIDLSMFNTSNVTDMSEMFANSCVVELDLSSFDMSNVTTIYRMFNNCTSLESLNTNGWNLTSCTDISGVFRVCRKIKEPADLLKSWWQPGQIPKFTSLREIFSCCAQLVTADLGFLDVSNVTNMYEMFYSCSNLKEVNLAEWKTANVRNMNGMFNNCIALEKIYVGNGWDTSLVSSYSDMFKNCNALVGQSGTTVSYQIDKGYTTVQASGILFAKVDTSLGFGYLTYSKNTLIYDFKYKLNTNVTKVIFDFATSYPSITQSITPINVSTHNLALNNGGFFLYNSGTTAYVLSNNTIFANPNCYSMFGYEYNITTIEFNNFSTTLTTNMSQMFYQCQKLSKIKNIEYFNTSNVTNMSDMFNGCKALTSLSLTQSSWNTSNVTDMTRMFYACSGLTSLNVSTWNTANVEDLTSTFGRCSKLTALSLPWTTTSLKRLQFTFSGCTQLTTLNLSSWNTSNVTSMYGTFQYCSSLTSINLTNWNTEKVTSMVYMFYSCKKLITLNLRSFVINSTEEYGLMMAGGMFAYCESLTTIYVADNPWMDDLCCQIDNSGMTEGMFYGCVNLKSKFDKYNTSWHTAEGYQRADWIYAQISTSENYCGYFTA